MLRCLLYSFPMIFLSLIYQDNEETVVPSPIPLTSEDLRDDGVYFLENGDDGLIYVGESVNSDILMKLFNVPSAADIPSQVCSTIHLYFISERETSFLRLPNMFSFTVCAGEV